MKYFLLTLIMLIPYLIYAENNIDSDKEGYATISGYIKDQKGEELIGANVYVKNQNLGTVSNIYGFYSLTLPKGSYIISYSYIGFEQQEYTYNLNENKTIDVKLIPATSSIEEVNITALRKDKNVSDIAMSNVKLQSQEIKKIPLLLGETDVIKTIQLLPGVQTVGEGSSGFYVRGGAVDQNLILLDDATVYNPSHVGGIFSVFNGDAIKSIELYKGGIPSYFGGRLASVLDVRMKEGNTSAIHGNGGIGIISSRLSLEGPVIKEKSSFMVSGRRTYADLFFPFSNNNALNKSRVYFYDLNAKLNYIINNNNRVFISFYGGNDVMKMSDFFKMSYGNATCTVRWNHVYNSRIFSNLTLIYSNFNYELGQDGAFNFKWNANVIDQSLKNIYTYFINPTMTMRFGFQSTYHTIKPGNVKTSDNSAFNSFNLGYTYAIENSVFFENEHEITEKLLLRYGVRATNFNNIGKASVYNFEKDDEGNYIPSDSTEYRNNQLFNTNYGIEPRLSLRYSINNKNSIKASYDRTYQYIHLATNTAATTPIDMWFLTNPNIKPQYADMYAIGFFKNINNNMFETSVELYYKDMYNAIDFKDHAELFLNKYFDGELRRGKAYSYGVEFFIRKQQGKLTGWISYTYAKTRRKIEGVNEGREYNAPYDKPHDLKIVGMYDLTNRWNFGINWVYSSPMPYTVASEWFKYENLWVPVFSDRNSIRIKNTAYHRMDVSATYHFKSQKNYEHSLQVSVYNAYNRHNMYSILYEQPENADVPPTLKKMYLFGVLPTITYNFNF